MGNKTHKHRIAWSMFAVITASVLGGVQEVLLNALSGLLGDSVSNGIAHWRPKVDKLSSHYSFECVQEIDPHLLHTSVCLSFCFRKTAVNIASLFIFTIFLLMALSRIWSTASATSLSRSGQSPAYGVHVERDARGGMAELLLQGLDIRSAGDGDGRIGAEAVDVHALAFHARAAHTGIPDAYPPTVVMYLSRRVWLGTGTRSCFARQPVPPVGK